MRTWKERVEEWAALHQIILRGEWGTEQNDITGEPEVVSFKFHGDVPQFTPEQRADARRLAIVIEKSRLRSIHDGDAQF